MDDLLNKDQNQGLTEEQSKAAQERNDKAAADKAAKDQAAKDKADKAAADKAAKDQAAKDKADKAAADKAAKEAPVNPKVKALREELEDNFKHYSHVDAFWVTTDNTPFFAFNDAKNHQLTLKESGQEPIKVER